VRSEPLRPRCRTLSTAVLIILKRRNAAPGNAGLEKCFVMPTAPCVQGNLALP